MSRRKTPGSEKLAAVEAYLRREVRLGTVLSRDQIHDTTFYEWVRNYQAIGPEWLTKRRQHRKYSHELKMAAAEEYLSGTVSQTKLCRKYRISSKKMLRTWISQYNGHKEVKQSGAAKGAKSITRGRKTTQQERAEMVAFCLEHGKDYFLTVEQYGVSYQQVYSWVRKYEAKGIDGLMDGRGRTRPESEMTGKEKLKAQVRMLEAQLRDKQMEIEL